jgi:medium-chain acyl-[acyl-carrier-protein] hydrolase
MSTYHPALEQPWVDYVEDSDQPIRLFCVPYAGGGPNVFRRWTAAADGLAVAAVRLPGRGDRPGERPRARLAELLPELATALRPHLDRPYALLGHSGGARIAFELIRYLRRTGGPEPLALFASGSRPPHRQRTGSLHELPDPALCEWLIGLGGMPRSLLQDVELQAAMLPSLRADLRLLADPPDPEPPLACPVRVYVGRDDAEAPPAVADGWRHHTVGGFGLRVFPGGHFFLRSQYRRMLADVAEHLRAQLGPRPTEVSPT